MSDLEYLCDGDWGWESKRTSFVSDDEGNGRNNIKVSALKTEGCDPEIEILQSEYRNFNIVSLTADDARLVIQALTKLVEWAEK